MTKKEDKRSETDSATIAELSRAIEDLVLERKQPGEGIMIEARQLARDWKVKDRSLFDGTEHNKILLLAAVVVGLVVALKRKVQELAEQKRTRTPEELEELTKPFLHLHAQIRELGEARVKALESEQPTPKPWQVSDKKRSKSYRRFYNSIEYQFGGGLVAFSRKSPA